jgi:hypothetical protein
MPRDGRRAEASPSARRERTWRRTNHRLLVWGVALFSAGSALGCGPTLQSHEDFTPERVREIMFDDVCQLQRYFDALPPKYQQRSDFSVGAEGHRTSGTVVYRLTPGPQTDAFAGLVERLYRRVPPLPRDRPLDVTVQYQQSKKLRTLPIGAETIVALPPDAEVELPYHPCVGAYFFGHEHYAARRALASP